MQDWVFRLGLIPKNKSLEPFENRLLTLNTGQSVPVAPKLLNTPNDHRARIQIWTFRGTAWVKLHTYMDKKWGRDRLMYS